MDTCPHCDKEMFRPSKDGSKLKLPTSMLVLHKAGDVEVNCPHCKQGVIVPLQAKTGPPELRKAQAGPRFIIKKGKPASA